MDCKKPGLSVPHHLPEFAQTHIDLNCFQIVCNVMSFKHNFFLVTETTDLKYLSEVGVPFVTANISFYTG